MFAFDGVRVGRCQAAAGEPVSFFLRSLPGLRIFQDAGGTHLSEEAPGHARCVACHAANNAPLRVVPLAPGETSWNEEESRKNFELVKRVATAGDLESPLLIHPLAESAGGDFFHNGGKHFDSKNDPEWLILKAFIQGKKAE